MLKTDNPPANRPGKQAAWWPAAILLALSLALLGWVDASYIVPLKELNLPNSGNDFGVFWSGTRTILEGHNPYLTYEGSRYREIVIAAGGNLRPLEPFISPLYLTLIFALFAPFPLGLAATLWLVVMQVLLVLALGFIIRVSGVRSTFSSLLQGLGLALLWRYTFLVMMVGNISLLLLFAVAGSYYFSWKNRPYLAGGLAAILLIKPQVSFLILPLLLVYPAGQGWLNRQTWQRLGGFLITCLVFAVYSFALLPGWVGDWLAGVAATGYGSNPAFNSQFTSLRSLVAVFVGDSGLVQVVSWALAAPLWCWLAWLWWHNRASPANYQLVIAIAVPLNILTTPYVRDYDSCLLLFTLLTCYFSFRKLEALPAYGWRWSWLCWPLALLPVPIHLLAAGSTYAYETIVPALLIGLTLVLWRRQSFLNNKNGRDGFVNPL